MGHNLGMAHPFEETDLVWPPYINCRKLSDYRDFIPCNECSNYQPDNPNQPIGLATGQANDCCNGFLGYANPPLVWSGCSVQMFEEHYIAENWKTCMDTIPSNLI